MALNLAASSKTSTSTYEVAFTLSYSQNTSEYEYTLVTITPYLRNTIGVWRPQHVWGVAFAVDNVHRQTYNYNGPKTNMHNYLPNDTAKVGVVGDGKLYMTANQWYQWGSPYTYKVKNDGGVHNFGLMMWCGTNPRYCPAKDTYLWADAKMPLYAVTPGSHKGLASTFVEDTRVISYTWGDRDVTTSFKRLHRTFYKTDGTTIAGYYIIKGRTGFEIYNDDIAKGPLREVIPEDVVEVQWKMYNYSASGHFIESDTISVNTVTDCKVWMKINGGWVKTIPWVKTPDGWKKATKTYVHIGNEWRTLII